MAKRITIEYRLELSVLMVIVFALVTLVGVVGVFFEDSLPSSISFLSDISTPFGAWVYWLVIMGPIGLVSGIWWLYDYVKKSRKLENLMKTPSKAKFVRNLDDIEYLAWSLPQRFEDRVLERKKGFGL
ncbi:MAG: DUF3198 domain-containing protein [Thermoplasmata archaeon]|nr:DUF3198 domain-containing protein [Thermoplasmata archaeon]TFG69792.1 MAG: DUF3198 domain-containing protein [Methanomassiliicoccus sp.]